MQNIRLRTDQSARHATWLELFYDLIYVIAIARLTHIITVGHHAHVGFGDYVQYVALFVPVWWAWTGHTMFQNRFGTDDAIDRILTLIQMFFVVMLAVVVTGALEHHQVEFAAAYILIRLVLIIMYARVYMANTKLRSVTSAFIKGFGVGLVCWIASLFFPPPYNYSLWALGLLIEILTPVVIRKRLRDISVHKSHLPERTGLLVIIVMGEAVLGLMIDMTATNYNILFVVTLFLAFSLVSSIWWLYFETMEKTLMGKLEGAAQLHIYGHLFIYIGLGIFASAIKHMIDNNFTASQLGITYMVGLLLVLIPMQIIHYQHVMIAKRRYFIIRGITVCLAIVLLGLMAQALSIIALLGMLLTALIFYIVMEQRLIHSECLID